MDWNLINYRKQLERDEPTTDLFSDRLFNEIKKKKRGATSPESEIREQMAILVNKPIPYICGKTKGWMLDEMVDVYLKASKWKVNPPALLNKLIRKKNEEIKKQLSIN